MTRSTAIYPDVAINMAMVTVTMSVRGRRAGPCCLNAPKAGAKPVVDPEHAGQHGTEGQHRAHAAGDVVIGDQHVVPVVQTQVGQLVEEPVDG